MAKRGKVIKITRTMASTEDKEFEAKGIEGTKEVEEEKKEEKKKDYVTCEDVLKNLRKKGYKV